MYNVCYSPLQAVSVCQTTIFSFILFIAYNSNSYTSGDSPDEASNIFPNDTFPQLEVNETDLANPASYSFSSNHCPFGFEPLLVSNNTPMTQSKVQSEFNETLIDENIELDGLDMTLKPYANTSYIKCVAPGEFNLSHKYLSHA